MSGLIFLFSIMKKILALTLLASFAFSFGATLNIKDAKTQDIEEVDFPELASVDCFLKKNPTYVFITNGYAFWIYKWEEQIKSFNKEGFIKYVDMEEKDCIYWKDKEAEETKQKEEEKKWKEDVLKALEDKNEKKAELVCPAVETVTPVIVTLSEWEQKQVDKLTKKFKNIKGWKLILESLVRVLQEVIKKI